MPSFEKIDADSNILFVIDPRVVEQMLPVLSKSTGNPSSSHLHGRIQSFAIEEARDQVAIMVCGHPSNVIFTAGATEANNLALIGNLNHSENLHRKLLVSAIEHSSVFETAQWIASKGLAKTELIPVTRGGFVDIDVLEELIETDTYLVSVMAANSETGVLNPIAEIAEIVHKKNALFHCDATQMVGRLPFDMVTLGCDMVSVSSHKIHGPTGVGALIGTNRSLRALDPIIHGGGHEQGLRSGSLNTAGIVGFGIAARIAIEERESEAIKVKNLRDYFVSEIKSAMINVNENGDPAYRLPNTANIRFEGADAGGVLVNLEPVSASMGSACSSGAIEPSRTLLAMGLTREAAYESIRFSLGRFTSLQEIKLAVQQTVAAVEYVRNLTQREAI